MKNILFLIILFSLVQCNVKKPIQSMEVNYKVSRDLKKVWYHKDIIKDSIPGISLDRAYQELIKNKKGKEIIVAVIDSQMDINHEDLKQAIWINKGEIPNNNIDDDKNGYIDDVNGWNFIGNSKGESVLRSNYEYVRVVKKHSEKFTNIAIDKLSKKQKYLIYLKALNKVEKELEEVNKNYEYYNVFYKKAFNDIKESLKKYFPKEKYTIKKLKSIKTSDKEFQDNINKMIYSIEHELLDDWIDNQIKYYLRYKDYYLNIDYNDRELIGDDENDITDTNYGYHNVLVNKEFKVYHATYVAGTLGATRSNTIGIKGISDNIKIMPVVISSNGDENDKDVALAIRYAVDNGAKIINMSFAKEFSIHPEWVQEALKYAAKNNVLCVHVAGNENTSIDVLDNFPEDYNSNGFEIVNNFIEVGSTTYKANKKLVSYFSNYGKKNVDIFAPGQDIYTTRLNNEYKFKDGTSMATPIVSGIAALIWSYYPNLKAHEVKEIILESGVSYNIDVELPSYDEEKKLVPFKSLSKSGKIVNAYNALLYAKNYEKWKAGKWPKK